MTAPDRQRDGGVYSPGTVCPHCGTCDVHWQRPVNPARPEELPFTVIRICTNCTYRFGQRA